MKMTYLNDVGALKNESKMKGKKRFGAYEGRRQRKEEERKGSDQA